MDSVKQLALSDKLLIAYPKTTDPRLLKNIQFCLSPKKEKILTAGIHRVF